MSDVFISYSRKDETFVRSLYDHLITAGRTDKDIWIDWEDIPPTADWWKEICAGIDAADTFVFVISPDSVQSEPCQREIQYATDGNKRMIPLLYRELADDMKAQTHPAVGSHHWIFFDERNDLDTAFKQFISALDTDLSHVRVHTRLLVRAREWDSNARERSYLLTGIDLEASERWMVENGDKIPPLSDLHHAYITTSRTVDEEIKAETALLEKRIRQFRLASVALGVLILVALVIIVGTVNHVNIANAEIAAGQVTLTAISADFAELQNTTGRVMDIILEASRLRDISLNDAITYAVSANRVAGSNPRNQVGQVLYDVALPFESHQLIGQDEIVTSMATNISMTQVVFGSMNNTLILWDVEAGAEINSFTKHSEIVTSVAFNSDGTQIISGSRDNTLILWDVETGEDIRTFFGHTGHVTSVAFNDEGTQIISGSRDNTLILWDVETGEHIHTFIGHTDQVRSMAFNADGTQIVSGSNDNTLILWDVATGEHIRTFIGHTDQVRSVAFNHDGTRIVSGSNDNTLILWDVETGENIHTLIGHTDQVRSVAFNADGTQIVSGSNDNTLILWDVATGEDIRTFFGHTNDVWSVAFNPDGTQIVSGSADGTTIIWRVYRRAEDLIRWTCNNRHVRTLTESEQRQWGLDFSDPCEGYRET